MIGIVEVSRKEKNRHCFGGQAVYQDAGIGPLIKLVYLYSNTSGLIPATQGGGIRMSKKVVNFDQAEKNARKRDFDIQRLQDALDHGGIPPEDLHEALALLGRGTGKELYIGTKRSPQSKVRFAQILQENLNYLNKNEYLTGQEKVFLMDITPYVAFESNALVFDIKAKAPVPMNITKLAEELGRGRNKTSEVVNSLVKKGLLAKAESGIEGNNAKAYSLFINPHIIFAGDKDNVPEHLQIIFNKAMRMSILKALPNKLF